MSEENQSFKIVSAAFVYIVFTAIIAFIGVKYFNWAGNNTIPSRVETVSSPNPVSTTSTVDGPKVVWKNAG